MRWLYKKQRAGYLYWWGSYYDSKCVVLHWGTVGEEGDWRVIPVEPGTHIVDVLKGEIRRKQRDGYKKIDQYGTQIVIQYQIRGIGNL